MKILILLLTLCLCACAKPEETADFEAGYPCTNLTTADDVRPDVLIIGDSISLGYQPYVQAGLPQYDVSHNNCNGMSTKSGVRHIDEWLAQRDSWEAITFNHGLWDIASWLQVSDAEYEANLRYVALKIKAKTTRPLFIMTTEVLPGTPYRDESGVTAKNAIAVRVMADLGIPVLDLHAVSVSIRAEHVAPDDVHYTAQGYSDLGDAVLDALATTYGIVP